MSLDTTQCSVGRGLVPFLTKCYYTKVTALLVCLKGSLTGNSQTGARIKAKHPDAAPQVSLKPSWAGPMLSPQHLNYRRNSSSGFHMRMLGGQVKSLKTRLLLIWPHTGFFLNGGKNDNESPQRALQRQYRHTGYVCVCVCVSVIHTYIHSHMQST